MTFMTMPHGLRILTPWVSADQDVVDLDDITFACCEPLKLHGDKGYCPKCGQVFYSLLAIRQAWIAAGHP